MKIGMLQVNVPDRAKALYFYREQLGFTCHELHGETGPFEVELNPVNLLIYQVDQLAPSAYETQRINLILYVDDLDAKVETWQAKGVKFIPIAWSEDESGTADCPYGRFIAFEDPFGNVLELMQPV